MTLDNNKLFIDSIQIKQEDLMNKLFCTFSSKDGLEKTLDTIKTEYVIMYNKIFVLESQDSDEYLCTYNIETQGSSTNSLTGLFCSR